MVISDKGVEALPYNIIISTVHLVYMGNSGQGIVPHVGDIPQYLRSMYGVVVYDMK